MIQGRGPGLKGTTGGPGPRYHRPPFSRGGPPRGGRPLLSRGRSMDQPPTSTHSYLGGAYGPRGSHGPSQASTPMSAHSLNVGSDLGPHSGPRSTQDYMSAPEDTGAWSEPGHN